MKPVCTYFVSKKLPGRLTLSKVPTVKAFLHPGLYLFEYVPFLEEDGDETGTDRKSEMTVRSVPFAMACKNRVTQKEESDETTGKSDGKEGLRESYKQEPEMKNRGGPKMNKSVAFTGDLWYNNSECGILSFSESTRERKANGTYYETVRYTQ